MYYVYACMYCMILMLIHCYVEYWHWSMWWYILISWPIHCWRYNESPWNHPPRASQAGTWIHRDVCLTYAYGHRHIHIWISSTDTHPHNHVYFGIQVVLILYMFDIRILSMSSLYIEVTQVFSHFFSASVYLYIMYV